MVLEMQKVGISVEKHHHETATAGQAEIDIRFGPLVNTADKLMMYKYIVKNVARRHGKTATFMPKPIFGDNGTGMHTHQSIWKEGKPLFAGKEYAGISQLCLYYIGGILKHAPALAAFTNPTTNSYKRLTPGTRRRFSWPIPAGIGPRGSGFPCTHQAQKPSGLRCVFPIRLQTRTSPFLPCSWQGWTESRTRSIRVNRLRRICTISNRKKRRRSARCRAVSTKRCVTSNRTISFCSRVESSAKTLIEAWIGYKRKKEVDPMRLRPHPYEYVLYYDV